MQRWRRERAPQPVPRRHPWQRSRAEEGVGQELHKAAQDPRPRRAQEPQVQAQAHQDCLEAQDEGYDLELATFEDDEVEGEGTLLSLMSEGEDAL
jgi:hypothetical protein